jgi:hypothetical protein
MGSYNWTRGASANSEDLNLVSSPTVAAAYTTHWRQRLAVSVQFDRREDWCRFHGRTSDGADRTKNGPIGPKKTQVRKFHPEFGSQSCSDDLA